MRIIFIYILLLFSMCACLPGFYKEQTKAGNEKQVYIAAGDSIINTFIWLDLKPIKLQDSKFYYWYNKDKINSTQGSYYGQLLSGDYTVQNAKTRMMLTKGTFTKGLKTGKWMRWHSNGVLKEMGVWKNGLPDGYITSFDNTGAITQQIEYENGKVKLAKKSKAEQVSKTNVAKNDSTATSVTPPADSIIKKKPLWKRIF